MRGSVPKPKPPAIPAGEAHLYGYIVVSAAVVADNLANHAAPLGHPVVLAHPHPHADQALDTSVLDLCSELLL